MLESFDIESKMINKKSFELPIELEANLLDQNVNELEFEWTRTWNI